MKKWLYLMGISALLCSVSAQTWAQATPPDCATCKSCCYDVPEDLVLPQCCELNDKYEFIAAYTEDGDMIRESSCCIKGKAFNPFLEVNRACCAKLDGSNERNGNTWVDFSATGTMAGIVDAPLINDENRDKCCRIGRPENFEGILTASCCANYGLTAIEDRNGVKRTEARCALARGAKNEVVCCARNSKYECGGTENTDRRDRGRANPICCEAAGGVPRLRTGEYPQVGQDFICCTSFGVREVGDTRCIARGPTEFE